MAIEIKVNLSGGEQVDNLSNNVNKTTESVKSLKQQFIDARKELMAMDESDPGFIQKATEAGKLKDQIADMNAVIKATAGSTTENLGNALTGVASIGIGAFQGIASAQALFGSESEDLQKVLVKLQAAAGMADAIKSFGQFGDTLTQVKASLGAVYATIIKTTAAKKADAVATGAQTAATEGATVAQTALNITMLANPIFLVIAAIGALVAAYYLFTSSTDTAAQSANELTESIKNSAAAYSDYKKTIMDIYGTQGELNAILSDEKVILAQDALTDILRNRPNDYAAIKAAQANLNAAEADSMAKNKVAQLEAFDLETKLDKDRRKQIRKELNSLRSTGTDAEKAARIQLMADLNKEDTELFNKELTRDDKRLILKTKLDNDILKLTKGNANEIADIEKKAAEYRAQLEKERLIREHDQLMRLKEITLSAVEFEKEQLRDRYATEIEAAKGNSKLQEELRIQLGEDIAAIDKRESKKKELEEADKLNKLKALYADYYQYLDGLETDPSAKRLQQLDNEVAKFDEALNNKLITQEEYDKKVLERTQQAQLDIAEINKKATETQVAADTKADNDEVAATVAKYKKISDAVQYYLNGLQNITEVFQQISRNRLEEDAENELSKYKEGTVEYENAKKKQLLLQEDAAKKAFNISKAFQLAAAINDGTLAVLSTFAQTPGELIIKSAAAAVAGVFAAANIARIATSKYKGSSSSGSSGSSSVSTPDVSSTPQFNLFGNNNNQNTTNASMQQQVNVNNQVTVKAVVSETEITDTQERVARYRNSATL